MKRKNIIGVSLFLALLMVLSTFAVQSVNILEREESVRQNQKSTTDDIITGLGIDPDSRVIWPIEVSKKIWNATSNAWEDSIYASVGETVRFNITITYYNSDHHNAQYAHDIRVVDTLPPCLSYADNAVPKEAEISGNLLFWNFTAITDWLAHGESLSIEFNANVISGGVNVNNVLVNAFEYCSGYRLVGSAEATVIVRELNPDIELIKKVKDGQSWVDSVTVNVCEDVEFRITIENTGQVDLTNVVVVDDLPSFLSYNGDAVPAPSTSSPHHIEWAGSLTVGTTVVFTFSAHADAAGNADNVASVTTNEGVSDQDTAHVTVEAPPCGRLICNKMVWNPLLQQWVEEIEASISDIVRFNISITYSGSLSLLDIKVRDELPVCLEYADNAVVNGIPLEPDISGSGDVLWWNLSLTLGPGESLFIEFDAHVISSGVNVNVMNVSGFESCQCTLYCEDIATVIVEEEPPCGSLICNKTVWDPDLQQWVEEIEASISDIVRFNITVAYFGDLTYYNIKVRDELPVCLEYADNAVVNGIPLEPDISSSGDVLWWNLSLTLGPGESLFIEFDAHVISEGVNVNFVNISGTECGQRMLYCEDTATVVVEEGPPCGDLICNKTVWDPESWEWVEEIHANICDIVRFNITVAYFGDLSFYNIKVRDELPVCLEYADNAVVNGIPLEPDISSSGDVLWWNLSLTLGPGESVFIEFDAHVISSGVNVNFVNISGIECGVRMLYCEDTATVIGEGPPCNYLVCEKTVWDPDLQQWVEEIEASISDIVRFKISVTYFGSLTLYDLRVRDELPVCLEYADNAVVNGIPLEPDISSSGDVLWWNLSLTLGPGESLFIEFDAHVISSGVNVNVMNVSGFETCGQPLLYCEDTATVVVGGPPCDMFCEKKVWDPELQRWVEEIEASVSDIVRFNISITYLGAMSFYNIKVRDELPVCLDYANDAVPEEPEVSASGDVLWWNLSVALYPGDSVFIEFDAHVVSEGENVNVVNVSGVECGQRTCYCEDDATVIASGGGTPLVADPNGPYEGIVDESVQFYGSATGGTEPYSWYWEFGDGGTSTQKNPTHVYQDDKVYVVNLTVTDANTISDTADTTATIITNSAPTKPSIPSGETGGTVGETYVYTASTTDPDGDQIWYWFDWGDGNNSGWVGGISSGATVSASYSWSVKGEYVVKVKARDQYYAESPWSDPLPISMPKVGFISLLFHFLEQLLERFPLLSQIFLPLLNRLENLL